MPALVKRRTCYYDDYGNVVCERSAWDDWVRWLVLALILAGFLLLFVSWSCISSRRRRRAGRNPLFGTGWAAGSTPAGHNQPQYAGPTPNAQPYYPPPYQQPAPPYSPPAGGYYGGGANQSYYGQQSGIELQNQPRSPPPAHVYEPPAGPPPGKDGVVR